MNASIDMGSRRVVSEHPNMHSDSEVKEVNFQDLVRSSKLDSIYVAMRLAYNLALGDSNALTTSFTAS